MLRGGTLFRFWSATHSKKTSRRQLALAVNWFATRQDLSH
jgi:hypothetical protein